MNILAIKQNDLADGTAKGASDATAAAPAADFSVSFADLLKTAGVRIEKGYNVLTDRQGVTSPPDDAKRSAAPDADGQAARQQPTDEPPKADDSPRSSDAGDRQSHDDGSKAETKTARSGGDDDRRVHDAASSPEKDDAKDSDTSASQPADNPPAASTAKTASDSDGVSDGTTPANGDTASSAADTDGTPADSNASDTGSQNAGQVLAGLLAAAQTATPPGQGDPAGDRAQGAPEGRANAVQGLSNALAAVTKTTPADGNTPGQSQTNANPNPQGQAHGGAQQAGQGQVGQGQAGQGQAAPVADPAASATSGAALQAAALSKVVGDGTPVEIKVDVTDRAGTVVSQPGPSLASSAVLAADGATSPQGTRQPAHTPVAPAPGQAVGDAGQAQGQAQGQVQAALAQTAQAAPAPAAPASGAASGPGPAAAAAPQAAGAEAVPSAATPAIAETASSHNPTAAPTSAAHRPGTMPQSVADQVSVQITKALKDGVDKIKIQLKPDSLGRVDVRLEVGHDGRVQALVTADNKDTLSLLQRDARDLQRALQDAGLQANAGDLSFSLRGEDGQGTNDEPVPAAAPLADTGDLDPAMDDAALLAALRTDSQAGITADGRIDIRA